MDDKFEVVHVERHDIDMENELGNKNEDVDVMGTVKLVDGAIVYIPTPTADPQGIFTTGKAPLFDSSQNKLFRSVEYASLAENYYYHHTFYM
jgi:hypothetical protein